MYCGPDRSRSFCYVDDLIEAMIRIMATPDDFTGPINIGNPREFSILELAHEVIRMTGSRSKIVFKPLPDDDPRQRQPEISLATKLLGWSPETELGQGLEKTIAHFVRLLS